MSEEKQQLLVDNGFEESSSETTQVTPRYFPGITGFFPIHYSQNAVKCLGIVQIVIGIVCLILLCKSVVLCDDRSLVGYYAAIFEGIVFIAAGLFEVLTVNKTPKRCLAIAAFLMYVVTLAFGFIFLKEMLTIFLPRYYPNFMKSDSSSNKCMPFWITLARLIIDGSLLSVISSITYCHIVLFRLPPSKRLCSASEPGFIPSLLHLSDGLSVHSFLEPLHPKEKYKMRVKQMALINIFNSLLMIFCWVIHQMFGIQIYSPFQFRFSYSIFFGIRVLIIGIFELLTARIARNKFFVIGIVVMNILFFCALITIPFYEIFRANVESEKNYYITPLYFFDVWYSELHVNGWTFNIIMKLMAFLEASVAFALLVYTCLSIWSAMGCLASYVTTNPLHVIDGYQYDTDIDCQKGYRASSFMSKKFECPTTVE